MNFLNMLSLRVRFGSVLQALFEIVDSSQAPNLSPSSLLAANKVSLMFDYGVF